jgi:phenol hydroxylase P5 protein
VAATRTFELLSCRDLSPQIRVFGLRLVGGGRFDFQAGQFITIHFTLDSQDFTRSYSIASPPGAQESFEVMARHNPGGPGTRFLWGLQAGAHVAASGPSGEFVLRAGQVRESFFFANGTGIAPVRSMIWSLLARRGGARATLLHGARDPGDLVYHSEFLELARRDPRFSYQAVLSRPSEDWKGLRGRLQEHVASALGGRLEGNAYLAGSPDMVAELRSMLERLGLPPEAIRYEK